jgi:hypothetical protein
LRLRLRLSQDEDEVERGQNGGLMIERRSQECGDECEQLIRNAEMMMDGAKMQLRQARRMLKDPTLLADRVERAKSQAMEMVTKALRSIQDLEKKTGRDDDDL